VYERKVGEGSGVGEPVLALGATVGEPVGAGVHGWVQLAAAVALAVDDPVGEGVGEGERSPGRTRAIPTRARNTIPRAPATHGESRPVRRGAGAGSFVIA